MAKADATPRAPIVRRFVKNERPRRQRKTGQMVQMPLYVPQATFDKVDAEATAIQMTRSHYAVWLIDWALGKLTPAERRALAEQVQAGQV